MFFHDAFNVVHSCKNPYARVVGIETKEVQEWGLDLGTRFCKNPYARVVGIETFEAPYNRIAPHE